MKDKKEISIEEFVLNYFGFSKNRITFDNEMVREIKIIKRVIPVVKGFLKEQHEKELKHEINTVWDLSKRLSDTEKELSDLKELILKTINIFEVALELKEVKSK